MNTFSLPNLTQLSIDVKRIRDEESTAYALLQMDRGAEFASYIKELLIAKLPRDLHLLILNNISNVDLTDLKLEPILTKLMSWSAYVTAFNRNGNRSAVRRKYINDYSTTFRERFRVTFAHLTYDVMIEFIKVINELPYLPNLNDDFLVHRDKSGSLQITKSNGVDVEQPVWLFTHNLVVLSKKNRNNLKFWSFDTLRLIGKQNYTTQISEKYFSNMNNLVLTNVFLNFSEQDSRQHDGNISFTENAFANCHELLMDRLPKYISNKIFPYSFLNCHKVTFSTLPTHISTIHNNSFEDCHSITRMDLSKNRELQIVEREAFKNCISLENVQLENTQIQTIANSTFYGCGKLVNVSFPSTLELIDVDAFKFCNYLRNINLQDTELQTIGNDAFYGCTALKIVLFPKTINTIGQRAFYNCKSLISISLSDTQIKYIYEFTFYGCTSMQTFDAPMTLRSIRKSAFQNCSELINMDFENTQLKNIGPNAFQGCNKLKTLTLPTTIMQIYVNAFDVESNPEIIYADDKSKLEWI